MHLKKTFLVYFLCGCFYESLYIAGAEPQTHPPEWIPVDFPSALVHSCYEMFTLQGSHYNIIKVITEAGAGCPYWPAGCLCALLQDVLASEYQYKSSYTCHFSVRKYCSSIRMNLRLLNVLQHCSFEVVYVGEGQSVWVDMEMMEWM